MENIHISWKPLFSQYKFNLDDLYVSGEVIYPEKSNIFKVFEMDVNEIRVVLLGQDPYHNPNQANGLSFSVNTGVTIPPSLKNIYKEIQSNFPERQYTFNSGNLEKWFRQEKIFLLNSSLTVLKNEPGSHMEIWEEFTNDVIKYISTYNTKCIFVLLGNFAKSKGQFASNKANIIEGVHPSPFSANKGFFGSGIFKRIEEKLQCKIDWSI